MGGVDTIRGIGYQQAQAVHEAIALLDGPYAALRVEGMDDVVDVEVLDLAGKIAAGRQFKIRDDAYTWGQAELIVVFERWLAADANDDAGFEFVTDGRLGPTGEEVRAALADAADGDHAAIAGLLGRTLNEQQEQRLSRTSIRVDKATVGALLTSAERKVAPLLPGVRSRADVREQTQAAVDRLFTLLTDRAGRQDPTERVITRGEIATALGLSEDPPAVEGWATIRAQYQAAAAADDLAGIVPGKLENRDDPAQDVLAIEELLDRGRLQTLTGPTGSGKSTTLRALRVRMGSSDHAVLVAHAEAFLAGRLDALVADAISDVLGRPVASATGRQALGDERVTLVVDGVSEVPRKITADLADDIRSLAASTRGAGIVLVGRDSAVVRSALPSSTQPRALRTRPLAPDDRANLVRARQGLGPVDERDHETRQLVARIDKALGDAAGNPMLLAMAADSLAAGVDFTERATLYRVTIERLAERTGITDLHAVTRALGIVFGGLLDDERRYADPYEWSARLEAAAAALPSRPDVASIDEAARRMGIVTTLGAAQTIVPLHDSFADYLAGLAAATGLSPVTGFRLGDRERLLFAAEIGGVDRELAAFVAAEHPLLSIRIAERDTRTLDADAPEEILGLLARLLPSVDVAIKLWQQPDRVIVLAAAPGTSEWIGDEAAADLLGTTASVSVTGGPLQAAVQLWRQHLRAGLRQEAGIPVGRLADAAAARDALIAHLEQLPAAVDDVVARLPANVHDDVRGRIGSVGMTGTIARRDEGTFGPGWNVAYRRSNEIDIRIAEDNDTQAPPAGPTESASAGLDYLLSHTPGQQAVTMFRDAVNNLTRSDWL